MENIQKEHFELLSRQLQIALTAAGICTWTLDLNSQLTTGDAKLFQFFGMDYPNGTSLAANEFIRCIHPEDQDKVRTALSESIDLLKDYNVEFRINEVNIRWVLASGKLNDPYNPTKLLGVLIDITEKKNSEIELRASEGRFKFMTNSVPSQVWTAKPDGTLDFINEQACVYFGRSEKEILGEGWQRVVHSEDLLNALAIWGEALNTLEIYQCEFRLINKNAEYR